MYDENPSGTMPKKEAPIGTVNMIYCFDEGGRHWGCPVCKTDAYLKDI